MLLTRDSVISRFITITKAKENAIALPFQWMHCLLLNSLCTYFVTNTHKQIDKNEYPHHCPVMQLFEFQIIQTISNNFMFQMILL